MASVNEFDYWAIGEPFPTLATTSATYEFDYWAEGEPIDGLTPTTSQTIALTFSGTLTPAGALVKETDLVRSGSITPSGTLSAGDTHLITLTGTITPAGTFLLETDKALTGAVTPAGSLSRVVSLVLVGTLAPFGSLVVGNTHLITLSGTLAPTGSLTTAIIPPCVNAPTQPTPSAPAAGVLYFATGTNPTGDGNYELWKHDGDSTTCVWDIKQLGSILGITSLAYCAPVNKVFINVIDNGLSTNNGGPGPYVNGNNAIYSLDPTTDVVTHVLDYNYVDTSPPSQVVGGSVIPAVSGYYDTMGGFLYFGHGQYGGVDYHLVRFDPVNLTVEMVFGPYDPSSYYTAPPIFGTQNFTDNAPGFIVRVGSILYYANGSEIFSSVCNGVYGSWDIVSGATIFGTTASWVWRAGGDFDIGLLVGGGFDSLGNYWFVGTNDSTGPNQWGTDALWNPSFFKIGVDGSITLVTQDTEPSRFHMQMATVAWYSGGVVSVSDGSGSGLTGTVFSDLANAGWAFESTVPAPAWNNANDNAATGGSQGSLGVGSKVYLLAQYITTGFTDFGVQLIRRDGFGTWSTTQRWSQWQLFNLAGQQSFAMALVPTAPPPPPVPVIVVCTTPTRAWINLYGTNGTLLAVFDDWKTLDIRHTLNNYSVCTLTLDAADARIPYFALDGLVQVNRQVGGTIVYQEYVGFHRSMQLELTSDQHAIFTSISRGLLDLLKRRFIYYQAVTAYTLKSDTVDNVIQQIVNENAGPGAITPPRYTSGVTPGLSVPVALGLGPTWAGKLDNENVLETLNKIVPLTNVDFDIVLTSLLPTPQFEFRTYYPQRGIDRSATLAFDPLLGNAIVPVYKLDNSEEVNVVAVLGPGQDSSRRVFPMQGADLTSSPWNIVESTENASSEQTLEGMQSAGQAKLDANIPKESFTFDVLQQDTAMYGRDYAVGDVVTARYGSIIRKVKIVGASVSIAQGRESVSLTFAELPL